MRNVLIICIVTLLVPLQSFADSKYGKYKLGSEYKIGDTKYIPKEVTSFEETGFASWYDDSKDPDYKTANGATFDKNLFTAAHKTLPMPSVVEIENLENGKKVIAVINDRGAFSSNKDNILDVTETTATSLGMKEDGYAKIKLKYLQKETLDLRAEKDIYTGVVKVKEKVKTVPKIRKSFFEHDHNKSLYVQIGVYSITDNAIKVFKKLEKLGEKLYLSYIPNIREKGSTIVRIGPYKGGFEEATRAMEKLEAEGYKDAIIVVV